MAVRIFTDSTSDISRQEAEGLGITVIPLTIKFGDQEYVDGVNLTIPEFYERLRDATELPKTSLISVGTFLEAFSQVPDTDEILGIFISSELSGSLQSSVVAKSMLEKKNITLIDSRLVAFGLSALVHVAVDLRDKGLSAEEIAKQIEVLKNKVVTLAVIDDLKYLKMGGRLSGASAAIGTFMHLKPVISITGGKVEVVHKALGLNRAFEWMVNEYKNADVDTSLPRYYGHADCLDVVNRFKYFVSKRVKFPADHVCPIGITVGTHSGPGAVGFCFFTK